MKKFSTLDSLTPAGKVVLLRADLNVPVQNGVVTDKTRLVRLAPTILELSDKKAKVVILSHFGRPRGKDAALSLAPIAAALGESIGRKVGFCEDCIGELPRLAVRNMESGDILVLENTRFYPEEEKNNPAFAAEIAGIGDAYVNDAFSCAHRAHATTEGITKLLPSYAGRLMEAELVALEKALENPARPVTAIVGGAKISTKIDLLNNLVKRIDSLVLGGGMANTFLAALGNPVGKSLCERDMKEQALAIIDTANKHGCKIILPVDGLIAKEFKENAPHETRGVDNIPDEGMMLDIGKGSVAIISDVIKGSKTILWNGPLGAFETKPFDSGTMAIAKMVADLTQQGKIISVAGGGDTVAALASAGVEDQMTYLSTAGGAFLEWLEGKELPGVVALMKKAA